MLLRDQYGKRDIEFLAEGTLLRGWLFEPNEITEPAPAIVMAHGYNCIKELYLDKYAEVFASAGFVVLVYDNRNFGDSDGVIRQELDPWVQVRDYRNAITFVQTLPSVDPRRIGIWGTSYSGGHVLTVAAIDRRVKCMVSQVPTISGWQSMLRRIQPGDWDKQRKEFDEDRLNRFLGKTPKMIPMVADASALDKASHASADAWEFFTGKNAPQEDQWRYKKWRNEITLRSVEMYSEYEPGSYIERIAPTPLLMVIADNDVVAATDLALAAFNRANEIKKLFLFSGNHFSAYLEKFTATANAASDWFIQHLFRGK